MSRPPPKPPAPLPQEDVDLFYDTAMAMAAAGGCVSVKDAATRAYQTLRMGGGLWANKSYSPYIISSMPRYHFSDEQNAALNARLGITLPPPSPSNKMTYKTQRFRKDTALGARLLDSVLARPSRPHLALEFDIPMELVSMALTEAVAGQLGDTNKYSHYTVQDRFATMIHNVSQLRPEWAPLKDLLQIGRWDSHMGTVPAAGRRRAYIADIPLNTPFLHAAGWSERPTDDESAVYQQLKATADKVAGRSIQPEQIGVSTSLGGDDTFPDEGMYSNEFAEQHFGHKAAQIKTGRAHIDKNDAGRQ